jgi:hypothetical protein
MIMMTLTSGRSLHKFPLKDVSPRVRLTGTTSRPYLWLLPLPYTVHASWQLASQRIFRNLLISVAITKNELTGQYLVYCEIRDTICSYPSSPTDQTIIILFSRVYGHLSKWWTWSQWTMVRQPVVGIMIHDSWLSCGELLAMLAGAFKYSPSAKRELPYLVKQVR